MCNYMLRYAKMDVLDLVCCIYAKMDVFDPVCCIYAKMDVLDLVCCIVSFYTATLNIMLCWRMRFCEICALGA